MASFTPKLGIDLGTTNVLVFVPGRGVVLNEPSVVAVSTETNKVLAIGAEAKAMIGRTPDTITAYRPMKDGVIADYRVTEAMLRYFIKKALGKWNLFKPIVLISVPAGVTSTEKRAVIEAAAKAGASNAFVVKEPILAAIGAGIPIQEALGRMVADIGGGTIDVAVISLGGIVASTSVKCAGTKLDRAIIDYVKKKYNLAIGDKTAEEIKIQIGSAVPVNEELAMAVKGRDLVSGLPRTIELKTNEVVQAMSRELRENSLPTSSITASSLRAALRSCAIFQSWYSAAPACRASSRKTRTSAWRAVRASRSSIWIRIRRASFRNDKKKR
jgi:rod shape-determining protein MreB